jgi:protein disulfide-isomerase A6
LVSFINEKAGTFRAPGGTLTALAGVIPSLDTAVASLQSGGSKAYKELYKQAGKLQDKTAEYYVKVAKKLEKNKEYVEKEFSRLSNLISKGNLAPEKLDELTTRKNILSKFKDTLSEEGAKSEL